MYGAPAQGFPPRHKRRPVVAACTWEPFLDGKPDALHIASWHPAVALAVADLLDRPADDHDETPCPAIDAALAVARAYLGEDA